MKLCYRCKVEKSKIQFNASTRSPDGLHSWCKICVRARNAERRQNDPTYKEKLKVAYERYAGSSKALEKSRRNHLNNAESERSQGRAYYRNNREKRLAAHAAWIAANRTHARAYAVTYTKKRMLEPTFALATRIRHAVRHALLKMGLTKKSRTFDLLGYTKSALVSHLASSLGKPCQVCEIEEIQLQTSHIDHITPISSARTEQEVIALNQLSNLRLICAKCNLKKGNKNEQP